MKKILSLLTIFLGLAICFSACKSNLVVMTEKSEMQKKVEEFAYFDLIAPELIAQLSENEKQLIPIFIQIAEIMDQLFWKQTFGDKAMLDEITDTFMKEFVWINYGPWERLNNNEPFVPGFGAKLDVCQYYPQDITTEEYEAYPCPNKGSLYTVLRRDANGELITVWYKDEYKEELTKVCALIEQAIELTTDKGMKDYLTERKKAFLTDDYFKSDMAWMDMKDSKLDFVVGPIENYDDKFQEAKASYEAYVLIKDNIRSKDLEKFVSMLPKLQKELPCEAKYKTFVPGTSSDLNVYSALYYGGDCNAGSKTIAINLPNDDRVAAAKGTRRLQLRNTMQAKFDKILLPIGQLIITQEQQKYLNFDAFFWNVTFHEVAHGLGVKNTINGKGSVDKALSVEKTSWEEAKADILGLFMVLKLIEMGEITNITAKEAMITYIAGILRSVRFGAASSHGKANMMCFNYFEKAGAFTSVDEQYIIDFDNAFQAMNDWAELIIVTQGNGDFEFAQKYRNENGGISEALQAGLNKINNAGIPRDIRFNQGAKVLGLE